MDTRACFEEFWDPERVKLLRRLDELYGNRPVPRELYACLWLSDIAALRNNVSSAENNPHMSEVSLRSIAQSLVKQWTQKSKSRSNSAASTPALQPLTPLDQTSAAGDAPSTPPSRSRPRRGEQDNRDQAQAALCLERDRAGCVVTHAGHPLDVAHIFPFAMRRSQSPDEIHLNLYSIWNMLPVFWLKERVNRWYSMIAPTTETLKNLFSLAPSVHRYHKEAFFALKPIDTDEDDQELRLTVQFAWLPRFQNPVEIRLTEVPSVSNIIDYRQTQADHLVKLWDVPTDAKICTGDRIVLETSDKDRLPLPDRSLLDMQWVLQRVAAMSAGAEPTEKSDGEDDDDDPYWLDRRFRYDGEDDDISEIGLTDDTTAPSSQFDEGKVSQLVSHLEK